MSKMSQESQVNLNFADYDKLGLRLSAISISKRGRSGWLAVLGQAVKLASVRNGNVALFSKIRQCEVDL